MDAEEKFETDVILEFRKYCRMRDPWFFLVFIMSFTFLFCNDLPGGGLYVRFLEEKYRPQRDKYDLAFLLILKFSISTMADLYGRRKVCCVLTTATCFTFIPIAIFTHFENKIASLAFYKFQYYITCTLNFVFFVNFIEMCGKFTKLTVSSALLSMACATKTVMLPMGLVYRKSIMVFVLTVPIFISWYIPESPLWLLNKNKSQDVLELLRELSGKRPAIFAPEFRDNVKYSQFRIWKESVRYIFRKRWKNLLLFFPLAFVTGFCLTQISHFTAYRSVPIQIPLSLCSVLIIVAVYLCLGLRLGIVFLNGSLGISEILNCILLLGPSDNSVFANERIIIIWFQYVLVWASETLILLYLADNFPTFVRVMSFGIFLAVQHGISTILQIIALEDALFTSSYVSGVKMLCFMVLGIVPLLFMREKFDDRLLANQKLIIS